MSVNFSRWLSEALYTDSEDDHIQASYIFGGPNVSSSTYSE